jgi:hypothetical protein
MKVETLTVKLLRSGERYNNDSTEIRVSLEDGDDWTSIERELRQKAEALIEAHWEQKKAAELAAHRAEQKVNDRNIAALKKARDEYLEALPEHVTLICLNCPVNQTNTIPGAACTGCPHDHPF